jgi:transcriptional regulator with XRE-family HTH domain
MTEKPYRYAKSDHAFLVSIGAFVRFNRRAQRLTQNELASAAGIGRSTLSLLERGEFVARTTLIHVLRVLQRLVVLDGFEVTPNLSPLQLARESLDRPKRIRMKDA